MAISHQPVGKGAPHWPLPRAGKPIGASLTLSDVIFIQDKHPDPPVIHIPKLHASTQWREVIRLKAVADFRLAEPKLYVHLKQLREEAKKDTRIPIISWMRNQATEGMNHAAMAGEHVTSLGGHPSLNIGKLVESHKHDVTQILGEALDHERATLREYYNLLALVVNKSVWLEEYAREQITLEEQHIAEVDKMMRKPGELHPTG